MVRLGDGTEESHARAQAALDQLWPWTGEFFQADDVDRELAAAGIGADLEAVRAQWDALVREQLARATLKVPDGPDADDRRPEGQAYGAPGPHARRDADRGALASGCKVVNAADGRRTGGSADCGDSGRDRSRFSTR